MTFNLPKPKSYYVAILRHTNCASRSRRKDGTKLESKLRWS
jgi:hypothetical protein